MENKYQVELTPAVQRQLKKLPKSTQVIIIKQLSSLKFNPKPLGVKKLIGLENLYRIKISNYRIVYTIEDEVCLIVVVKIGDRKEVYRNLRS